MKQKETRNKLTVKAEGQYNNKTPKRLKGRINAPVPIMGGFVDTLQSKIDDPPVINIGHTDLADLKKAKKVSAAFKVDSAPDRGMWDIKDLVNKKQGIFWGRAFFKIFAESDPHYQSILETPDPADMAVFDTGMGSGKAWNLENHFFVSQANIIKSKWDLKSGTRSKIYNKDQVAALIAATGQEDIARIKEEEELRRRRLANLGVDVMAKDFTGEDLFNLAECVMEWKGERIYLLFDLRTKLWVRVEPNKDLFKSDLFPWVSYGSHTDSWHFWNKASVDDVYPIAEMMRIILMEGIHNLRKRTSGMRAVDSSIFPDLKKMKWGPDKTIFANALRGGKQINQGIYEFQTEDNTTITINLIEYLNNFLAQKTGVNAESQGQSDQKLVGIAFLNTQQAADRFNLMNRFYRHAWTELGKRYVHGLEEHMTENMLVEMIGSQGTEWEELTRKDLKPNRDFTYKVTGGQAEAEANALKQEQKAKSLGEAVSAFPQQFNEKVTPEQILRNGGWEETEITLLMNPESAGNEMLLSEAEQAIQEIVNENKSIDELTIPFNGKANKAFLKYIMDYVDDFRNALTEDQIATLMRYFEEHTDVALQNERSGRRAAALTPPGVGNVDVPPPVPGADTPPLDAPPRETPASPVPSASETIARSVSPVK